MFKKKQNLKFPIECKINFESGWDAFLKETEIEKWKQMCRVTFQGKYGRPSKRKELDIYGIPYNKFNRNERHQMSRGIKHYCNIIVTIFITTRNQNVSTTNMLYIERDVQRIYNDKSDTRNWGCYKALKLISQTFKIWKKKIKRASEKVANGG